MPADNLLLRGFERRVIPHLPFPRGTTKSPGMYLLASEVEIGLAEFHEHTGRNSHSPER